MTSNPVETSSRRNHSQTTPPLVFVCEYCSLNNYEQRIHLWSVNSVCKWLAVDKQSLLCQIRRNNLTICGHNSPVTQLFLHLFRGGEQRQTNISLANGKMWMNSKQKKKVTVNCDIILLFAHLLTENTTHSLLIFITLGNAL